MKTTKLAMIVALVSFALMTFANTELGLSKNVIALRTARANAHLVSAIHNQVNPADIFNTERAGNYTAEVMLKKTVYLITGSIAEWKLFFRDTDGRSPLLNEVKKPVTFNDANNFGVCKVKINPLRQKNPFSNKGKKPVSSKKIDGKLSDR